MIIVATRLARCVQRSQKDSMNDFDFQTSRPVEGIFTADRGTVVVLTALETDQRKAPESIKRSTIQCLLPLRCSLGSQNGLA